MSVNETAKEFLTWSPEKIQSFRETLLNWYDEEGRDLPWRRSQNPYHIWVSEVMLQQTQVATVIPYYERFIEEIPTIKDLAEYPSEELMKLWQGLGYYSRVRNMQTAAQQITADFNGEMPDNMKDLLSLKGIGPYTAAAIGSICFNLVEPAIDGNLMRVTARLLEIDADIGQAKSRKIFKAILDELIDPNRPGDFNQALMDIGATIMTPSNTQAEENPLKEFDLSYHNGTAHLYPVKKKKVKQSIHQMLAYYIRNSKGQFLMRQHQEGELLTGLWHFPLVERDMVIEAASPLEVLEPFEEEYLSSDYILEAEVTYDAKHPVAGSVKHVFSHRIWQVKIIPLTIDKEITELNEKMLQVPNKNTWRWLEKENLVSTPLSTLQRKLFKEVGLEDK